jgi:bifunctional DNase/RNase
MAISAILLLAVAGLLGCEDPPPELDPDVRVHVGIVAVDAHDLPVVVLQEEGGGRSLPIWIGAAEARSIARQMERKPALRPNTHDLAKQLILGLDGEIVRVVVTELRNNTYFATIALNTRNGAVDIDARPSDAIAIALRSEAPIFVRASLLDSYQQQPAAVRSGRPI